MLRLFRLSIYICLFSQLAIAQSSGQAHSSVLPASVVSKIHDYVASLKPFGFSGQIMVELKGQVVASESLGFADRRYLKPVTSRTLFSIGSVTKSFTAAAVLQLEAQKRLALSDPLSKFFPDVPSDKASITLQQLLTHNSGLRREVAGPRAGLNRQQVLHRIWSSKLSPQGDFHYSNAGYQVLAAVIETVSGKSYESYLREDLLLPAGVTNVCFEKESGCTSSAARGYNEWKEVADISPASGWLPLGNTGILASAGDLLHWMRKLSAGELLPEASTKRLFSAQVKSDEKLDYAYGWYVGKDAHDEPLIMHGGDNPGYHTELRFYPRQQATIVILCNQDRHDYGVYRRIIANDLANILSGRAVTLVPPAAKEAVPLRWLGEFHLPQGGIIAIYRDEAGQDWAGLSSQEAINTAMSPTPAISQAEERSSKLVEIAVSGDQEKLQAAIPGENMAGFREALSQDFQGMTALFGKTRNVEVLGSVPLFYEDGAIRTFVRVRCEDGIIQLFLGWNKQGGLYDLTFNDDRPYPVMIPVAWKDSSWIVGFDYDYSKRLVFELKLKEGEPDSVSLNGKMATRFR